MTERQLAYLTRYATRLGLRTFGDLARYKREKGAKTNGDLIAALWQDLKARELSA